ncbi:uncharacterized protein LOC119077037 [Bradysia coprophila]|uniref:uncharacterized protein LOC119077037 n=1 Tax=Bradysia coprophila TaxID=38358 RepID=UPI00187DB32F|nr:uncharacterized protein LOC119077037 [Bradysia coprophila]
MPPVGGFAALCVRGTAPSIIERASVRGDFSKIKFSPNFDSLTGSITIHFETYRISHNGIKVQLAGHLDLAGKCDTNVFCVEATLPSVELVHGHKRLDFHLTIPQHQSFPTPFVSSHGSLTYRIYAYIKRGYCWDSLASKVLKFKGHYNILHLEPNPFHETKVMSINTGEVKSTFRVPNTVAIMGQCDGIQGILELNGVLGKSQVDATLTFFRNTSYGGDCFTEIILSQSRHAETHQTNAEFRWSIDVPMMKRISYSHPMYSVHYYIKYEVLLGIDGEQYASANGVVELEIGTSRDSHTTEAIATSSRTNINTNEAINEANGVPEVNRRRSAMSLVSMMSLPPAYSQLSSMFGSMMSLETLPPQYEDLKKE